MIPNGPPLPHPRRQQKQLGKNTFLMIFYDCHKKRQNSGRIVVVCSRIGVVCGRLLVVCSRIAVVCGRIAAG